MRLRGCGALVHSGRKLKLEFLSLRSYQINQPEVNKLMLDGVFAGCARLKIEDLKLDPPPGPQGPQFAFITS